MTGESPLNLRPPGQALSIGGRMFSVVNLDRRTVMIDGYLQRQLRESGADRILPAQDEPNEQYLLRLHAQLMESDRGCALLAGYLLPLGSTERDWTAELAARTSQHLQLCDTSDDRNAIDALLMECVLGFFRQRLALLLSFQNSLLSGPRAGKAPAPPPPIRGRSLFSRLRNSMSKRSSESAAGPWPHS